MTEALLSRIARKLSGRPLAKECHCPVCEQDVVGFMPYRGGWADVPPMVRLLEIVGSDVKNWACPSCNAHDRERHLLLYLVRLRLLGRFAGARVLHFAPERRLIRLFEAQRPSRYVKADLFPDAEDIERVDLLEMPFPDASVDIVLANHVLEHVADDRKGVREIRRVLAPGGFAILQTPYSARLHATLEDPGINDDAARLQLYGQEDHVRLFGRDIFGRFAAEGLVADIRRHDDLLSDIDPLRYGVNRAEPLFLFHRA